MSEIESLRQLLESSKGEDGRSLHEHLVNIFSKLVYDRPSDLLSNFELYSQDIKLNGWDYISQSAHTALKSGLEALLPQISEMQKFIGKPVEVDDEGQVVEIPQDTLGYIPDMLSDRILLRFAGIDLGEEESFLLQVSLKKLVRDKGARDIRFWGKIHGTKASYYIVEGVSDAEGGEEEEEKPADFEKRGEGVNTLAYWASTSPFAEWTELPDVSPDQIKAARAIRKLFTGDLEAAVVSNPHFPGREKHLLRVQLARITHSAYLIPKGGYRVVEDTPNEIEAEEEPYTLTTQQCADLQNWQHYHPSILRAARITHMDPEVPDDTDIDPEELKAQIMEADPSEPRLKTPAEDKHLPGVGAAWAVRLAGDIQEYDALPPKTGKTTYAVNVIRSLWWPGHVTIQQSGVWTNFYVGDGLKAATTRQYPISPPLIVEDPDDPAEVRDPFPENPPEEKEDDEEAQED